VARNDSLRQSAAGLGEADRVATPFQHDTLEIVVEQNARHAAPGGERGDMATQEALHAGIEKEAQEDLP
jgi:hypothetical protein